MPPTSRPSAHHKRAANRIVRNLIELYPTPRCALDYKNAFELLVATILSAQCTDARVNLVTPALFARYPNPQALAQAEQSDVEEIIHSAGFYRSKAKNLLAMAAQLVNLHQGEVPADLDALTQLPGVGRKTAHVVLGNAFGISSGIVVDTHVKRLSYRLGLTKATDPVLIEKELAVLVPQDEWINFSHRLIEHGRSVCDARKPRCGSCELREFCPQEGLTQKVARRPQP